MLEFDAKDDDPVVSPDRRQSDAAASLQRGVCRALRALGLSVITELPLANGRRADVLALSQSGESIIVEIKSSIADFRADRKWGFYRDYADRLYFAVANEFPAARVDACDTCQTYLKSIDLTKDGHAIPMVDEIATVALNIWADERDYVKLETNLLGM